MTCDIASTPCDFRDTATRHIGSYGLLVYKNLNGFISSTIFSRKNFLSRNFPLSRNFIINRELPNLAISVSNHWEMSCSIRGNVKRWKLALFALLNIGMESNPICHSNGVTNFNLEINKLIKHIELQLKHNVAVITSWHTEHVTNVTNAPNVTNHLLLIIVIQSADCSPQVSQEPNEKHKCRPTTLPHPC